MNRSPISIQDHGDNVDLQWAPDGSVVVIQVPNIHSCELGADSMHVQTCSHLLLVDVKYSQGPVPYRQNTLAPDLRAKFLPGPGEGMPLERIHLSFQGVIPIDGTITRWETLNAH